MKIVRILLSLLMVASGLLLFTGVRISEADIVSYGDAFGIHFFRVQEEAD